MSATVQLNPSTRPAAWDAPWERKYGETARAYAAFVVYRDLGPKRALNDAYRQVSGNPTASAPGGWTKWQSSHDWLQRALAYDAWQERQKQEAISERLQELGRSQVDFLFEEFNRLTRRVRKADGVLDKADTHPITDVVRDEETVDQAGKISKKRTRIRGINFAGYATLMKEIRDSARRAIVGPTFAEGDGEPQHLHLHKDQVSVTQNFTNLSIDELDQLRVLLLKSKQRQSIDPVQSPHGVAAQPTQVSSEYRDPDFYSP